MRKFPQKAEIFNVRIGICYLCGAYRPDTSIPGTIYTNTALYI